MRDINSPAVGAREGAGRRPGVARRILRRGAAARGLKFLEGVAGAVTDFFVVFLALGHGEGLFEGFFGGGALAVGEEGEGELDAVRREVRGKFGGAPEMADGLGGGGVGEAAIDELEDDASGSAEGGDLVVPTAEDVVGIVVVGIEGEGFVGVLFHETGVLDLGASLGIGRELAVADGEREDVDGVLGLEGDGALGAVERLVAEPLFLLEGRGVGGEVGVLVRELLQDERIVGPDAVSLEEEIEGGLGIEAGFGGEGGFDQWIGGVRGEGGTQGEERKKEKGAQPKHGPGETVWPEGWLHVLLTG